MKAEAVTISRNILKEMIRNSLKHRNADGHPIGEMHKEARLDALIAEGGIQECGNAQNCREVCPKEIPLTTHIAAMNKETTKYSFRRWFTK